MTIDEAIAHAREKADEQTKDYNDCLSKELYGCKDCAYYYPITCKECAEEHEQLAQWLEELKQLRKWKRVSEERQIHKFLCVGETVEEHDKRISNKAIEEYKEKCCNGISEKSERVTIAENKFDIDIITVDCAIDVLYDVAEELKGG